VIAHEIVGFSTCVVVFVAVLLWTLMDGLR
jgi:hypothetical protein